MDTLSQSNTTTYADSDISAHTVVSNGVEQVVFSSIGEQIFVLCLITLLTIYTLLSQTGIIFIIFRTECLHIPHFYVILGNCTSDIAICFVAYPAYFIQYINGSIPLTYCRIDGLLAVWLMFGEFNHIGFIAFERYSFFCKPFHYNNNLSKTKIFLITIVIYIVPAIFAILSEFFIGR